MDRSFIEPNTRQSHSFNDRDYLQEVKMELEKEQQNTFDY